MAPWNNEKTDMLCQALLSLQSVEECRAFLEDICTIKEVQDLSQRLYVAEMLARGCSYATITKETGVSTTTISRISRCYEYGAGGYGLVLERMGKLDEGKLCKAAKTKGFSAESKAKETR